MISVIIVNYNTLELTAQCVSSILENVKSVQYEIIVVDNASKMDNPQLLKERFPSIKLVCNETNLGFAKGNNIGISVSIGEEILLLNSDTVILDDVFAKTSKLLHSEKNIGIVTCRLQFPDGKIQHNCQPFPSFVKWALEKTRMFKLLPMKLKSSFLQGRFFNYDNFGEPDWVWGTYFHFKRELLMGFKNKELASDFFMYVEDMQWCYEARLNGWRIAFEPDATIIHLMGQSKGARNKNSEENVSFFIEKYYSPIEKFLFHLIKN
jgi:GT2 family glycosyltransferase